MDESNEKLPWEGKKVKGNKNALAAGHYVALSPSNGSPAVIPNAPKMHPKGAGKERGS